MKNFDFEIGNLPWNLMEKEGVSSKIRFHWISFRIIVKIKYNVDSSVVIQIQTVIPVFMKFLKMGSK